MAPWYYSDRKVKELLLNLLCLLVVLVSWFYVIRAGKVLSERYLDRVDLSQFYREEREHRHKSGFWVEKD